MFCPRCGREYSDRVNFCCQCGAAMFAPPAEHKLRRSRHDKKIAGVCGGFGEYLGVDPTLVRLIWLVAVVCGSGPDRRRARREPLAAPASPASECQFSGARGSVFRCASRAGGGVSPLALDS